MRSMILAAGLGTRLKPWTDNHPKALALVNGRSLLQRNIEYLQQFEIKDVVVNVHHFAEQIVEVIERNNGWGSNITISDETNEVLETGGGLQKTAWYFNGEESLVLLNSDVLTDMPLNEMIAFHKQQQALATLATTNRQTSRYFLFDDDNVLCGWRNVKTGEEKLVRQANVYHQKAFSGIHVISTKIFSLIPFTGKFSMVDVYLALAKENNI
ncbi:MAG TPA: sugar phosphate nucleotidyltransferase, partial [Chitinophagaceae bacterium]|nr:sugar phosphate nucleotidyltransferase [Chitinophagaceae bacterium]